MYSKGTWSKNKGNEVAASTPIPLLPSSPTGDVSDISPGNIDNSFSLESDDLDVPIAVRKGVRSCTQHPISNFVSYSHSSPTYRSFLSNIASVFVPNHVQDALGDPKWKRAMDEEMKALHKSGTWELTRLPKGKRTVVSEFTQ